MKKQLKKNIASLNELPITEYMKAMGYPVIEQRPDSTDYGIILYNEDRTITVDYQANRFNDEADQVSGDLVNLVCLLFGVTPKDVCADIMPWGLGRLWGYTKPEAALP